MGGYTVVPSAAPASLQAGGARGDLERENPVKLHQRIWHRLLGGLVAAGLLTLAVLPAPSGEQPKTRDQQIADIEKQIAELNKKLNELRNGSSNPPAVVDGTIPDAWIKSLTWRSIGPAAMGGRIVAISVLEKDPSTYWVATASGGLLKTVNNGTTFEHQFDRESTVSIGDVCVAPSNRNIVWVGTGENNPRNSVSYGDGVYKSTDGGKTWKNMGLKKSFQVGRVVVHPSNPDIVYVGALGRLYGPNGDRGLFKTTDGGKNWERVLFVNDRTGVIDVQMNPVEPETLLVATWERQRDGHDSILGSPPADGYDGYDPIKKWGPGSGVWKTTDGGKTFHRMTKGLPDCPLGRIGIDYYRKDPKTVFAIVDCEKIGMGPPPNPVYMGIRGEDVKNGAKLTDITEKSPAAKAGLKAGDVVVAMDANPIANYDQLREAILKHKAADKFVLKVIRDKETKEIPVTLENRPDEGGGRPPAIFLGITGQDAPNGVQVRQVFPEGPAAKAGIQPGNVILAADKKKVTSLRQLTELARAHKVGDKFPLQVLQGKETKEIVMVLAGRPAGRVDPRRPYRPGFLSGQVENVQDRQGKDGVQYGGVYKSTDGGESWTRVNSLNPRPMYFSQVRVDPNDDKYVYVLGISLYRSNNGGQKFTPDGANGVHPDQHALWIDPKDGRHMIVGCDGGFYVTYDRMAHWDFLNHMAIGQFYHVALDNRQPYHVYGGLQDNGSWGGPSRSLSGAGPINEDWIFVSGGDGFVCRVDSNDPDQIYFESQDGNIGRVHLKTGKRAFFRPQPRQGRSYRWNWNTPFILSSHNPRIYYCAGNFVFRSLKQGDNLRPISPEITRTKQGSATALAESPRNPDVLYAGTDDGALWVTRDGGAKWTEISKNVSLPGPRWVASIEPSRKVEGRVYVAFDAHRSDDDEPYIYVSEDYGQTWKPLRANLPTGSTRVLREDVENPDLLFLGTEFACWVSINRGASWTKLNNNLPTVAVHELAIHPTAGEMVAATHGRSLWALDVTPLRQMSAAVLKDKAHLFQPNTVVRWRAEPQRGTIYGAGARHFFGDNPPQGVQIYYALTQKAAKAELKIVDYTGKTVGEFKSTETRRNVPRVATGPGLHRLTWNMVTMASPPPEGSGQGPRQGRGRGRRGGFQIASPGMYRVVLTVDGKESAQSVRIDADPTLPNNLIAEEQQTVQPPPRTKKVSDVDD
jgi:photosystem II stability/assembly factor-like uncharacterized protein